MSVPALSLHAGVPLAHLSARIQAAVQKALDERRLVGAVVLVARRRRASSPPGRWLGRQRKPSGNDHGCYLPSGIGEQDHRLNGGAGAGGSRSAQIWMTLERWLPEFRPRLADGQPARIAVWQLLSHTAGLGYRFFETDTRSPMRGPACRMVWICPVLALRRTCAASPACRCCTSQARAGAIHWQPMCWGP